MISGHRPPGRPAGARSDDAADRGRLDRRRRDARRNPRGAARQRRTAASRSPTARSRISSASSRPATCSPRRSSGEPIDLKQLCRKAPVIPDLMDAMDALAVLRSADVPLALVHDEYGHLDGIVTPGSILAALAGTFAHDVEQGEEPPLVEREDGSWLVSGAASADLLADRLGISLPRRPRLFDRRRLCLVGAQASAGDGRDVPPRRLVVRDRRHGRPQDRQADRLAAAQETAGRSAGRSRRLELSEPLLEAVDVVAGEIIGLLDDAVAGDAARGTRRAARRAARSRSASGARVCSKR